MVGIAQHELQRMLAGWELYSGFGLARAKIRELAFAGDIPGVTKASW